MRIFDNIVDAFRSPPTPPQPPGAPARPSVADDARIWERVSPDGSLVSSRGPVTVYALESDRAPLPNGTVLYAPRSSPQMRFRFTIVRCVNGDFRAYIREQPGYGARASDAHTTHRLHDQRGRFVCWSPMPRSAADILKVTRLWADRTARYIATGVALERP